MAGKKQFDADAALDAAMVQFWRAGYASTSVDDLSAATGLNRSSLYATFGDKESLYLLALERYTTRYGRSYDAALSCAGDDLERAVRQFFAVTTSRIADADVPDGCLVAQSALSIPTLTELIAGNVEHAVASQRARLRSAFRAARMPAPAAEKFSLHVAAVNHSLAVMSRAGADAPQLQCVVDVSLEALSSALASHTSRGRGGA